MKKIDRTIILNNHKVELTNLSKLFWPDEKISKEDLINYYDLIAKFILPYLKDRPESLNRFPNGINGKHFYQKNFEQESIPNWVDTISLKSEEKDTNYLLCQNKETLLYIINLGCVDLNPWSSRIDRLDYPDYMVIDLDPLDIEFDYVIEAAQAVKKVLDKAKIPSYPKTSGASGMHIYVPVGAKYTYDQVKQFAKIITVLTNKILPNTTSIDRMPAKRRKKVYLDFLQNNHGQTLAAPYSIRPVSGACVSTPLKWVEVKRGLRPTDFTIKNIFQRLDQVGDIFEPVLGKGIEIKQGLEILRES